MIDQLAERIVALGAECTRTTIAISGFGGSGKSTLADALKSLVGQAVVVRGDNFLLDYARGRSSDWACVDRARLRAQVLEPFRAEGRFRYQPYDWVTNQPGDWHDEDAGPAHLIVEGVGLIHPDSTELFDFVVWIDCPADVALRRARERDRLQGAGDDNDRLWLTTWAPNDADFYAKYKPRDRADFIYRSA